MLENKYVKIKTSLRPYKKQMDFCHKLYKMEKKKYYVKLDLNLKNDKTCSKEF